MRDEPPKVSKRFVGAFIGAIAILGVLVVVVMVMTVYNVVESMDSSGPQLSSAARSEIAHANCQHLARLNAAYAPNADSVEPAMTALRLTRERQAKLGCDEPDVSS